jgi:hypothetical protein
VNLRLVLPISLAATALLLSACGGDDEASTSTVAADDAPTATSGRVGSADGRQSLNEAFAAVLMDQQLTENPDEALCAANGIISTMGEDRLAELGMTADNIGEMSDYAFTEAEQTTMLGQLFDCIDITGSLQQEYLGSGLTEEQAACVVEQLDVDALKELASSGPGGGDAAIAAQAEAEVDAFAACGVEG